MLRFTKTNLCTRLNESKCGNRLSFAVVDDDEKDDAEKDDDEKDDSDNDDSDDKVAKPVDSIPGEKVPITVNNRLGTGGLKALEKVNTLIKQSDGLYSNLLTSQLLILNYKLRKAIR